MSASAAATLGAGSIPVTSAPVHRRTHRSMAERSSLDFKNRFFWRIQKKWFLVSHSPRAKPLEFALFSHELKGGRRRRPCISLPLTGEPEGALAKKRAAAAAAALLCFRDLTWSARPPCPPGRWTGTSPRRRSPGWSARWAPWRPPRCPPWWSGRIRSSTCP